jgi:hypothetical protein
MSASSISTKLRISGMLLIVGLLVTIFSLVLRTPLAFLIFAAVGGLSVFAGVAVYLYSLLDASPIAE